MIEKPTSFYHFDNCASTYLPEMLISRFVELLGTEAFFPKKIIP